jgi:MSHA biogenesis protein MshN
VLYGLAAAALDRKDLAEGQAWTQRLLREHAASDLGTHALLRLAAAAEAQPRPDVARQAYRDLLTRSTTPEIRTDAWFGLAEAALAVGDGGEAQRAAEGFLREVPADDPRAVRAHLVLVRALEAQGQRDRAVTAIEGFLRQYPRDASAPALELRRGRLLAETRRWDQAQQAFDGARRADDPAVAAEAEFWLGEALRARGEHEAAVGAYLAATYAYPESSWAARGLQGAAQAFVARQMTRDAAIVLRKLAARPGVDPALAQWAREALASLGAGASAAPAVPAGAAAPKP